MGILIVEMDGGMEGAFMAVSMLSVILISGMCVFWKKNKAQMYLHQHDIAVSESSGDVELALGPPTAGAELRDKWRQIELTTPTSKDHITLSRHLRHRMWDLAPTVERVIVVGDVHGCREELVQLLEWVEYSPVSDALLLVGDLVNKGPDSAGVLAMLTGMTGHVWAVRGNHDEAVLSAAVHRRVRASEGRCMDGSYTRTDGTEVDLARYAWTDSLTGPELTFLDSLPYTIALPARFGVRRGGSGSHSLVVHAGLVPGLDLARHRPDTMMTMRGLRRVADEWEASEGIGSEGFMPWAQQWTGPAHVVFGHDARLRLQTEEFATGLDTGCLYGGELTALILPQGDLVTVPSNQPKLVPLSL